MTNTTHRTISCWAGFIAAAVLASLLPPAAISQQTDQQTQDESKTTNRSQPSLAQQAYAKTKTAKTIEEFTEVIKLCEESQQEELPKASLDYVKNLQSWAHNKRGESYAEQSGKISGDVEQEKAGELEKKAMADFLAAIDLQPTRWRAVHNRGVSHALLGQFDEAIRDFGRTIELKPNYANAWFNRGEIRYAKKDYQQALADYNRTIRLKPNDAGAYNSRGHTHYRLRKYQEALDDYGRAVQLDDTKAVSYANRADAYADQGYYGRAARDYRRAIDLDDRLGRAYQGAAWMMATCPDMRFRDAGRALLAAKKAIELDGEEDYRYLDTLAAAHANEGRFDRAKEALEKAIQAAPREAVERLNKRLDMYQEQKPYREAARSAVPTGPRR